MPARCRKPAEQRFAPLLLVEMEALRIELRGEFLDVFRGEGEGAELKPLPHLEVFEETHACYSTGSAARRLTMIGEVISASTCPAALRTLPLNVTMPVSGRLRETRA